MQIMLLAPRGHFSYLICWLPFWVSKVFPSPFVYPHLVNYTRGIGELPLLIVTAFFFKCSAKRAGDTLPHNQFLTTHFCLYICFHVRFGDNDHLANSLGNALHIPSHHAVAHMFALQMYTRTHLSLTNHICIYSGGRDEGSKTI